MDTKQRLSQMRGEAQLMAGESVVDAMRERRERAEAQEAKAQRRQLAQARARARDVVESMGFSASDEDADGVRLSQQGSTRPAHPTVSMVARKRPKFL
eukprot:CAMPEP_0181248972 /NCGR_PEP_ID=MMETSP1096-20121128/45481_1 /TAXON_ID=156174 ORGANISM="Chrysochromulina ericina, Strain CCMP281" /NCGR_SAMPLE_ID=MMETSP1096 /ASSEMBLY_ACC=CAM_ASM_000453 /LENGTH=97 /DNA_ID=CAMNT_0023346229 /DNA_START=329 /DNA_END=622 /DNA_ORIENTATION=+